MPITKNHYITFLNQRIHQGCCFGFQIFSQFFSPSSELPTVYSYTKKTFQSNKKIDQRLLTLNQDNKFGSKLLLLLFNNTDSCMDRGTMQGQGSKNP